MKAYMNFAGGIQCVSAQYYSTYHAYLPLLKSLRFATLWNLT